MPVGIIGAVAGAAVSAAVPGIFGSILGAAVSFAIKAAFSPTPKSPSSTADSSSSLANQSQTLTSLEPAAAWEVVYGEIEKGGKVVFRHATDERGEVATTETHNIPSTAPFTVTISDPTHFVSNTFVTVQQWQGDGYLSTGMTQVGSSPAALQYAASGGTYTFNEEDAGKSVQIDYTHRVVQIAHSYLHLIIVLAAHECSEIQKVYFNGEEVTLDVNGFATGRYTSHALIKKHLGSVDQEADATLMAEAPDKWTSNHRLRGHCYLYVRLRKNPDIFPAGVPNITALIRGRLVSDTRVASTIYSSNWALCLADYLNHPLWGLNAAYATEIDNTLLNATASICDEAVTLAAGGTENRYEMHGIVDTSQAPQDIIGKMLTAGAGRLVYVGGRWRVRCGAYITPTVTLDESDARGAIRVQTRLSRREVFNAVKGVYISPDNNYQPADFPPVTNATYQTEDGGERVWFDMELPFTRSTAAAQRIAKIELERVRQQITLTYPAKLSAYKVEPPETMMLTNSRFGYSSKVFEVMESRLVTDRDDQGHPVLGVNLALRETASGVFDWNSGNETTVDLAPDTSLPDGRSVGPPGVPTVTEEIYEASDSSGVKSRAVVTWAAAPDAQAWRYEHEYKLKDATQWTPQGFTNGTRDEIVDLPAGVYQSRVRAVSTLGVRSTWSQTEYEIYGLTAAPADVAGFAVQSYADKARFVWQRSTDLDVRIGGRAVVRWSPVTVGANWNSSTLVDEEGFPGDSTGGSGPLMTGTYMVKFKDSTGHYSVNAASFVITEALLRDLVSLDFVDLHPLFTGTHDDTVVTDDSLQLTSMTLWDDVAGNVDDFDVVDFIGGTASSGSSIFDDVLDLGAPMSCRLFTTIQSEGYNIGDTWDARTIDIDEWGAIDGDVIEDAEVTIGVRITNDEPVGSPSPTWGPWHSLGLVADYYARGFQFRADFVSADPTHNRRITELTITAKEAA